MIRFFDIVFSLFGLLLLWPVGLILYIIGLFDTGSPIFVQERVGKNKKPFKLYKFRTMKKDTVWMASHLVDQNLITPFGSFLRRTKLDELPQIINVLIGDMSLVGPRPCLYNQTELIEERERLGIYNHVAGITGLAQINEIDMSTPKRLAKVESEMLKELDLRCYFKYIFATLSGKGQGDRVKKE